MKFKLLYPLLLLSLAGCQDNNLTPAVPKDDFSVVPTAPALEKGRMMVKFKEMPQDLKVVATRAGEVSTGDALLDAAAARIGLTSMQRVFPPAGKFEERHRKAGLHLWYHVTFNENIRTHAAIASFAEIPGVVKAEGIPVANSHSSAEGFPYNDQYKGQQWHLYNDGSKGGIKGADLNVIEAWQIEKGKREVIVSIVDNFVDVSHPDLQGNLWINEEEYNQDPQIDNDGNGYAGDWYGYNANDVTVFNELADHGTHVAGIIAAKNNNEIGVCGIAGGDSQKNGVRFMTSSLSELDVCPGIVYAADHGAVICNNSWGGEPADPNYKWEALQEAINYFVTHAGTDKDGNQTGPMRGGVFIASAGNEGIESKNHFPASYDNVISVANIGADYVKAGTSNYADWIDISAFGGGNGWNIFSTLSYNLYGALNGTSQAAPCVSGVAALIVSKFGGKDSGLTADEVIYRLKKGCVPIDKYNTEFKGKLGAGCINAKLALADNFAPDITPINPLEDTKVMYYGEKSEYAFTINDYEDGTEITYTVDDDSCGIVTHRKEGDKVILTLENKNCQAGLYTITISATDKEKASSEANFTVRLLPENKKESEITMTSPNELTIGASMTFSGKTKVEVFDASGNTVLVKTVIISLSQPGKVDLSGIDGGTYTVKLSCNNKTITKNIIKL